MAQLHHVVAQYGAHGQDTNRLSAASASITTGVLMGGLRHVPCGGDTVRADMLIVQEDHVWLRASLAVPDDTPRGRLRSRGLA
jgi:hypothetical protein